MSDKHPIRNGVIASVVAGIILAALGQVWPPARKFLGWLWASLSTRITLPLWSLLLIVAAMVVGLFLAARGRGRSLANDQFGNATSNSGRETLAAPGDEASRNEVVDLSGLEREMLRRIAKEDGEPVYQDTLKRSLSTTNLRLEAARDRLIELDLVEAFQEGEEEEHEISFVLTTKGRQYVIDRRLA